MALSHRYVAIYPSGATDPISDDPQGDPGASYSATYTSMASMEAAENGDLTSGDGTLLHVEIIPSDSSWSGIDDTGNCTFDGWKTDRSGQGSYVEIKTYGTARSSNGLWDTSAYRKHCTVGLQTNFYIDNDATADYYLDLEINNVQFSKNAALYTHVGINTGAYHHDIRFLGCYLYVMNQNIANLILNGSGDETIRVKNCILDSGGNGAYSIIGVTSDVGAAYIYNNTLFNCDNDGIESDDNSNVLCKNNAVFNNVDDWVDTFTGADYNASDDNDVGTNKVDISPGSVELDDWHDAFFDPDGSPPDVRIKDTNSCLYHAGLDQNSDSEVPSDDIIGTTRPAGSNPVSIGAFEYSASGPLTKNLDDTINMTEAHVAGYGLSKADTILLSDSIINGFGLVKADSISLSDTPAKQFGLTRSDSLSLSDVPAKQSGISKSDSISLSDALIKQPGLFRADSISLADNLIKQFGMPKSDSISLSDSLIKQPGLFRADSVSLSDNLSKQFGMSKSDSISLSDTLIRQLGLYRGDSIALSDEIQTFLSGLIYKNLNDTINLSDANLFSYELNKSDLISLSDLLLKEFELNKTDIITLIDNLSKMLGMIEGLMSMSIEGKAPNIALSASAPGISMSGKKPNILIEEN